MHDDHSHHGRSRGIGAEMVAQLRHRGDTVIAATRGPAPHLAKLGAKVIEGIEVTDPVAIVRLAGQLEGQAIDVLINNAGITNNAEWESEPLDIMRQQFEVNALAPVEVTRRLLPLLAPKAKIVMITSRLGSIADTVAAIPDLGYRMSKAALNIAGKLIAESLRPKGITVLMIHPGYVRTEMNNGGGRHRPQDLGQGRVGPHRPARHREDRHLLARRGPRDSLVGRCKKSHPQPGFLRSPRIAHTAAHGGPSRIEARAGRATGTRARTSRARARIRLSFVPLAPGRRSSRR